MINGVEMLYDHVESTLDYTYSYIAKDGHCYVYCRNCKKFEKMDVLANFDIRDVNVNHFYFENYYNDEDSLDRYDDKTIIYKKGYRYYSYERFIKAVEESKKRRYYNTSYKQTCSYSFRPKIRLKMKHLYRDIKGFVCPECNTYYNKTKVLYFETRQAAPKKFCYGVQVFREPSKNGMLIKATLLFIEFGIWNDAIIFHRSRKKITFNATTGHTYALRKLYIDGSKRKAKGAAIKNITYNDNYEHSYFFDVNRSFVRPAAKALYDAIYEEKVKILGHRPDGYTEEMPDDIKSISCIPYLSALNRFPNLDYHTYHTLIKVHLDEYFSVMNKDMYKVPMNADDWVSETLRAHKVKASKFNKRLIRNGIHPSFISAASLVIKEPSNVLKLIKSPFARLNKKDFESEFIKDMLALCGETTMVNKILACHHLNYLTDTINMYHLAKQVLGSYDITGTIREIHDNLSKDYPKLKKANLPLEYEDKVRKLECSTEDYDLVFAKDTHELIDTGSTMRICVGSYGDSALRKQCNIMILKDKEGKPIVCIELSGDYKTIRQAKYYGNSRMPQKEFDFITKWVKSNKFEIHTNDLDAPKKDEKVDNFVDDLADPFPIGAFAF